MKPRSTPSRLKDDDYPMTPESIARARAAAQAERDELYRKSGVYIDAEGRPRWRKRLFQEDNR